MVHQGRGPDLAGGGGRHRGQDRVDPAQRTAWAGQRGNLGYTRAGHIATADGWTFTDEHHYLLSTDGLTWRPTRVSNP